MWQYSLQISSKSEMVMREPFSELGDLTRNDPYSYINSGVIEIILGANHTLITTNKILFFMTLMGSSIAKNSGCRLWYSDLFGTIFEPDQQHSAKKTSVNEWTDLKYDFQCLFL